MVTQRTRQVDSQTISDEHGKGAEFLRQHVASHSEPSSAAGAVVSNHQIMYCEVDMLIRYLRLMAVTVPDANADLIVYRNRAGTIVQLAGVAALDGYTTEIMQELTLTIDQMGLNGDDTVYAIMTRDASSEDAADWAVYFGWMPDIQGNGRVYRTYT